MQAPQQVKQADRAFWRRSADALLIELEARLTGLTQEEADKRLRIYGLNRFEAGHGEAFLVKLGKRVLNPLVALLIAAAAVSGISGDYGSFFIIVAVLALSMTLDIVQEYRAQPGQCDISTGTVIDSNMPRVTPPRMRSLRRE